MRYATSAHSLARTQGNEIDCCLRCHDIVLEETIPNFNHDKRKADGEAFKLFETNALFLYENAEKILSDSRMMLASVGFPGFLRNSYVALGEFLNWWRYEPDLSRDKQGNIIVSSCGNPMTGSNATYAINKEGEIYRAEIKCRFIEIVKSFNKFNPEYSRAKRNYIAFCLREVIDILNGRVSVDEVFNGASFQPTWGKSTT